MNKLIEQIASVLKLDAETLQKAYTDNAGIELGEYFSAADVETLKANLQKAKYDEGKTAGYEIGLKEMKRKYGELYNIETDGIKTFEVLYDKILEKVNNDHKEKIKEISGKLDTDTQGKIQSYESKLAEKEKEKAKLQADIQMLKGEMDTKVKEISDKYNSEKINALISNSFQSLQFEVPKHIESLGESEISKYIQKQKLNAINLFKLEHSIDFDEEGKPLIKKNGEVIKDQLQNNESLENLVMPFCKENFIGIAENVNGRQQRQGTANINMNLKGKSLDDFEKMAKEKGYKPNTKDHDVFYAEYKKANPD